MKKTIISMTIIWVVAICFVAGGENKTLLHRSYVRDFDCWERGGSRCQILTTGIEYPQDKEHAGLSSGGKQFLTESLAVISVIQMAVAEHIEVEVTEASQKSPDGSSIIKTVTIEIPADKVEEFRKKKEGCFVTRIMAESNGDLTITYWNAISSKEITGFTRDINLLYIVQLSVYAKHGVSIDVEDEGTKPKLTRAKINFS